MDNTLANTKITPVSNNFHVNLTELPNIISDKIRLMDDLNKKVEKAKLKAKEAEQKAKELQGFKEKEFLGIKWKSGDTKENIKETQAVVSALSKAQIDIAEAQDLSFKFQKELANTSEYLFYLGCYNIAANEAMIANLNEQLRGDSTNGVLSTKVKEQFKNVVKRLIEQKDVLYRQQQIEEKAKQQDRELHKLNEELIKREEDAKNRDKKINEQSGQISELLETLKQKDKLDDEQSLKIEELINILKTKDILDKEQTNKIFAIEDQIADINDQVKNLSQKLNNRTIALCILSIIVFAIIAIRLIGL